MKLFNAMLPKDFNTMIILDISIDGFFGMISFKSNIRSKKALKIECNNLSLMSNSTGEIMDISAQEVNVHLPGFPEHIG